MEFSIIFLKILSLFLLIKESLTSKDTTTQEEKTTQDILKENREKILQKENQKSETTVRTNTYQDKEKNFGRIRLFKIKSRKTRNYVKILGFSLMLALLYLAYDVAQTSLLEMGYGSIQLRIMVSLGPDLIAYLLVAMFAPVIKRRTFIRFAQIPIFCKIFIQKINSSIV